MKQKPWFRGYLIPAVILGCVFNMMQNIDQQFGWGSPIAIAIMSVYFKRLIEYYAEQKKPPEEDDTDASV